MTQHPKEINGMRVIRIASTDKDGNPILKAGEGAIKHNDVFYVIDDQIALQ